MAIIQAKANINNPLTGIILMLFAFFIFSLIDVNAKWLVLLGLPSLQMAFMRYIGHFVISTTLISSGGFSLSRFGTNHAGLVVLRGTLLMVATICNFIAIQYISLTLTATILFSAPLIICALSWPLLGERVGIWRWSAILLGFCGILIAMRPFGDSFHIATLLSLFGAFCFALYQLLTRKLSGIVANETMQFYTGFIGTAALLPAAVLLWESPETVFGWAQMISLGILGWFGHEILTRAHGFAPSSTLSPFGYSFILYMAVGSYLIFDQAPDGWMIVGAVIIIISGLIIWFREAHKRKHLSQATSG